MKVAVITTSRADWNSLGMVAKALREQGADVHVLARNHAGIEIVRAEASEVMIYWTSDLGGDVQNVAMALVNLAAVAGVKPDMALLCGDRLEMLLAAVAVAALGIPIAHLAGGDVTGGSLDERWRHAITKVADVHFPTHEAAAMRIAQMGEDPRHIHMTGSAAVDRIKQTPVMPIAEVTKALGLPDSRPFILGNWQAGLGSEEELPQLLEALANQKHPVVWVGLNPEVNSDWCSEAIAKVPRPDWRSHQNLPPQVYLSALEHCFCLIGNSSSGFYEAPYFATPVINVGSRQAGREPMPECMINVPADSDAITKALLWHGDDGPDVRDVREAPFGHGAAQEIARVIIGYDGQTFPGKRFRDQQGVVR